MSRAATGTAPNAELASYYRGTDVEREFGVNRKALEIQGHRMLMIHGDGRPSIRPTRRPPSPCSASTMPPSASWPSTPDHRQVGPLLRDGHRLLRRRRPGLDGIAAQNVMAGSWSAQIYAIDLQNPDPGLEPYELSTTAAPTGLPRPDHGSNHASTETRPTRCQANRLRQGVWAEPPGVLLHHRPDRDLRGVKIVAEGLRIPFFEHTHARDMTGLALFHCRQRFVIYLRVP